MPSLAILAYRLLVKELESDDRESSSVELLSSSDCMAVTIADTDGLDDVDVLLAVEVLVLLSELVLLDSLLISDARE